MGYVTPEQIAQAKEWDLLTYLQQYDPHQLVHVGGSTYCTREHDSLKISNGKWNWFSRKIGGKTALDYLIKVQGFSFTEAVEALTGPNFSPPSPAPQARPKEQEPRKLVLPQASRCATHVVSYLHGRGIDYDMIDYCIQTGRLYESLPYHNAVFVGQDQQGQPRYAALRGIIGAGCSSRNKSLSSPWLSASTFRTTPASTRSASTWTMTRWAGTRQRVSWLAWGTDTKCWTGRRPAARM
mgnify:CR=1 FL=1